ncbi:unnamed protein product [Ilex paraguariensis]|uniref:NB-ARC domain-containing protein n=1 Tax=Ilex paraguariensis TaxID=185542 RepID=A0ABC8TE49_9AQUA
MRKITSVHEGIIEIKDALHFRKVLLVLDDVDEKDQLDAILNMHKFFHPGSKILITTTNMRLLRSYKVEIMDVKILNYNESLELFSWHAFQQHRPIEGYMEYSKRVVKQCGGLPLALEVLGAALRNMEEDVWKSTLDRFEVIHDSEIQQKLQISYEHLPDDQYRNSFLDIACFFVGMDKAYAITILDGCGYFGPAELQTLIDRCLIKIRGNKLMMHTLIQRMGREIIRQLSPEKLGKRSRLWKHRDSFKVLKEKIGTKTIRGLALNMKMLAEDMHTMEVSNSNNRYNGSLETNAFQCMHELRLLEINYVQLVGGYKEFPNNIRWLCWHGFWLKYFPNDFPMDNLVAIDMRNSSLEQLWKGAKCIESLKILDLRHCHGLKKTPMFSGFPSLERLILKGCVNLVEVHESIGSLGKLVLLNMKDCRSLEKLPTNIGMLSSLETLNISGCSNLEEVPLELKEIKSLKTFQANEIDLSLLPSTTEENRQWHPLMWFGRSRKRTRPQLSKFFSTALPHSLVTLSLAGCNLSDGDFPKDFSSLTSLEVIDLSRNPICNLPDCIKGLDSLSEFYVFSCTSLQTLVGLPHIKRLLSADGCTSLEKITHASSSASMTHFEVEHCVNLVEVQGHLLLQPILNTDTEIIDNFELSNIEFIGNIEAFLFSMSAVKGKALPTQVLSLSTTWVLMQ